MYRIEFYKRFEISITIFKLKYRRPYAMPNVSYFGRNNPLQRKEVYIPCRHARICLLLLFLCIKTPGAKGGGKNHIFGKSDTSAVNFINVKRTNFTYECAFVRLSKPKRN